MARKTLYKNPSTNQIALNGSEQILLKEDGIITSNLILYMDAASNFSFRGEPTVNLFDLSHPYFQSAYNAPNYGFGDSGALINQTGITINGVNATKVNRSTNGIGVSQVDYLYFEYTQYGEAIDTGKTKTYSFDYYGTKGESIMFYTNVGTVTYSSTVPGAAEYGTYIVIPVLENQWCRIDVTVSDGVVSNGNWMVLHYNLGATTLTANDYYIFKRVQLEMKHLTPYVNGTRGTTVATGGGWLDLSGSGNHGSLIGGVLYTPNNFGGLIFDGNGDYINCGTPSSLNLSTSGTVSVWAKIMDYETNLYWALIGKGASAGFDNNGYTIWYYNDNVSTDVGTLYGSVANRTPVEHLYGQSNFGTNTSLGNTIHNFTLTWNATTVTTYLDGVYVNSASYSYGAGDTSSTEFWVARTYQYCNCYVYNVLVYNTALSSGDVLSNFNALKGQFGL